MVFRLIVFWIVSVVFYFTSVSHAQVSLVNVEGQPLGANVERIIQAFQILGHPLPAELQGALAQDIRHRDAQAIQKRLDEHVLLVVHLNPEVRVKVQRGPAKATISQNAYTPVLVKVVNESTVTRQLSVTSPQAGKVYAGSSLGSLKRQQQTELKENENDKGDTNRFLNVEMFQSPPLTRNLSGLECEYVVVLVNSSEAGKRDATIGFDVGEGTQDIGFRGETPVLFEVLPAVEVLLTIRDQDGSPTTARLVFRDPQGRIYPSQAKRLAPDFFFQEQIYRADGDSVLLPVGQYQLEYSRGPEYVVLKKDVFVAGRGKDEVDLRLKRWVNPMEFGFYCGDHHIHGAGCSHYTIPTEGVTPRDMFLQVKGEGLNVGCVLTWGPCFDHQRKFFSPVANTISEPFALIKYDLEISGFGSAALGHVCLLNLKDQTYPGSEGTKAKGWPTWTVPVMRWCKEQGGVTGYPHSAMRVNPEAAALRMVNRYDADQDQLLSAGELQYALLPEPFGSMDDNDDGHVTMKEVQASVTSAANQIPNLVVPEMNGPGAMEIFVSTAENVCDFISAMDTSRIGEWNTWYHLMNCGFPLKLSGETDFPCMSSRRVGQGRVYVQMGDIDFVDYRQWCHYIAKGRAYVSDGYAHALSFTVNGTANGFEDVNLDEPGTVTVEADVAFSPQTPVGVVYGNRQPPAGIRDIGDTRDLHASRSHDILKGGERLIEIVVNGRVVANKSVQADGQIHHLEFPVSIDKSSWVALRHFPQLHTNPVNVMIRDKPIRASSESARWCIDAIELLWKNRSSNIAESERDAASEAYQRAIALYKRIAEEARR